MSFFSTHSHICHSLVLVSNWLHFSHTVWHIVQPRLWATFQAWRLSLFGNIAWVPDESDAKHSLTASPSENWRRPAFHPFRVDNGRPRTTWMKTTQQDLKSMNLSLNEATDVAQNRPLWRLLSMFGATHVALIVVHARNVWMNEAYCTQCSQRCAMHKSTQHCILCTLVHYTVMAMLHA